MSRELIDRWLDNELDDKSKMRLEAWLRDDPDNLQSFFDAVRLQEDLRVHYSKSFAAVAFTLQSRNRGRLIIALSLVVTIAVAGLFIIPRQFGPRATDDPLVGVISGNPQLIVTRASPGPNPAPIPREQWPVETQVTVADNPSSLQWDESCVLEADAGTAWTLRSETNRDGVLEPRSIHLNRGVLTVRLESPPVPIDIFVEDSRIRVSQSVAFTLKDPEPQPFGGEVTLFVIRGDVELVLPGAGRRRVTAGEQVALP